MNFFKKFFAKLTALCRKIPEKLHYSSYVKEYLFTSNVRSCIYLSIVIALLEIWMLISVISGVITSDGSRSFLWIVQHTAAYVILLITAVCMLIYSVLYMKSRVKNSTLGQALKIWLTVISLAFGLFISYASHDRSGQVFAFITMETFCVGFLIWQPLISFLILSLTFGIYYFLQSKIQPISYSVWVNSFTCWIAMLLTSINVHHQRRVAAQNYENLEKLNEYLRNKSLVDELTGLANFDCFQRSAIETLQNEKTDISKIRFIYIDIENFKNYNEKYGFRCGNKFLRTVGQIISHVFTGELVARFSDDHFIALAKAEGIEDKLRQVKSLICEYETEMTLGVKAGGYAPKDRFVAPLTMRAMPALQ